MSDANHAPVPSPRSSEVVTPERLLCQCGTCPFCGRPRPVVEIGTQWDLGRTQQGSAQNLAEARMRHARAEQAGTVPGVAVPGSKPTEVGAILTLVGIAAVVGYAWWVFGVSDEDKAEYYVKQAEEWGEHVAKKSRPLRPVPKE